MPLSRSWRALYTLCVEWGLLCLGKEKVLLPKGDLVSDLPTDLWFYQPSDLVSMNILTKKIFGKSCLPRPHSHGSGSSSSSSH